MPAEKFGSQLCVFYHLLVVPGWPHTQLEYLCIRQGAEVDQGAAGVAEAAEGALAGDLGAEEVAEGVTAGGSEGVAVVAVSEAQGVADVDGAASRWVTL